MKKLFLLLAALAVLAGCANNHSSKKPQAPAEEPAPVEAEAEPVAEPVQQPVHHQAQPLMQPVKADVEEPQASAPVQEAPEEAAPAKEEKSLTVDALCSQFGVYELLSQYDRCLKDGNKKGARKLESQLGQLKKQVKNDAALPEKLRESFKNYIDDKQEEIGERY